MKYGIREICDVVFKAKANMKIGNKVFHKGRPVLYIDSAKTSTIEGAATTVYAQGGRGNSRLIAWEGEKTLTFTVEDALLSPISFSMLSGAGVIQKDKGALRQVHVHLTAKVPVVTETINSQEKSVIELGSLFSKNPADSDQSSSVTSDQYDQICWNAPLFAYLIDSETGEIDRTQRLTVAPLTGTISAEVSHNNILAWSGNTLVLNTSPSNGTTVFIDCYVLKYNKVTELQIDAEHFAGSFYVEASTLFREKSTGIDRPAEITFPNVKIQSNFTFSMASSGDPSTFTFTMDAMPGYTYFNKTKEVLCVMQIVEDESALDKDLKSVMSHSETGQISFNENGWSDSYNG